MDKKKWYPILVEEIKKHGKVPKGFGNKYKIPRSTLGDNALKIKKKLGIGLQKNPVFKKCGTKKGGIDSFRNQFDDSVIVPRRIEDGVEKYLQDKEGSPCWMRDKDFREACGVGIGKWRRFADEYKELQVTVPGDGVIWGHPDIIDEMRRAVQR